TTLYFSPKTDVSLCRAPCQAAKSCCWRALSRRPRHFQQSNRQYVGLIYAVRLREQDGSVQQRECGRAGDMTMLQSLLLPDGLDASDIEILWLLGAAFMPSILGMLLAFVALWLPDEGYVLSQRCDDRQHGHHRANDRGHDWRRAA